MAPTGNKTRNGYVGTSFVAYNSKRKEKIARTPRTHTQIAIRPINFSLMARACNLFFESSNYCAIHVNEKEDEMDGCCASGADGGVQDTARRGLFLNDVLTVGM